MKILALEKETLQASADEFQPYLREEAARVYELYLSGMLREFYFHAVEHTAVLVLESSDLVEAQKMLEVLPLVKAGLITFDLIPLAPYTGLGRLFQGDK